MVKAQSNTDRPGKEEASTAVPSSGRRTRRSRTTATVPAGEEGAGPQTVAASLSYNEARTALELSLSELQASDLDVEAMAGLYRRAEAYAERCEQLLNQVEQDVLLWTSDDPKASPAAYAP